LFQAKMEQELDEKEEQFEEHASKELSEGIIGNQ